MDEKPLSADEIKKELQSLLLKIDTIYKEAIPTGEFDLGWARLERCKARISEFLRENVSDEEAQAFRTIPDPFSDLGEEIDRCRNLLVTFLEELDAYPNKAIQKSVITLSTGPPERRAPQLEPLSGAGPKVSEEATLSWLWDNVPVKIWGWAAGILFWVFIIGSYASGFPVIQQLLRKLPGYSQGLTPILPPEKAEQVGEKVRDLIAAHNQRLSDLQKQLLHEERLAGDHSLLSGERNTHRSAADKIQWLIEKENENFRRELEALKYFTR